MKASVLIKEIQEKVQSYPIDDLKNRLNRKDIDRVNFEVGSYNLKNYEEIINYDLKEDFEVNNQEIQQIKDKMIKFFIKYPVEMKEFEDFITYICIYLTLIAKKPLHPVGFYFEDNTPIYEENGKYYCKNKEEFIKDEDAMCHNCISIF